MIDDGTVFRLGPQNFRWVYGDDYCSVWLRELAAKHELRAWVRSSTDQLHNIAVQGSLSRDLLRDIVSTPSHQPTLTELKWRRFTVGRIADVPVVISRTGYTGELGYEIWCHPDRAPQLWDAGQGFGLTPMGLALDIVRIEAGLVFAGYDFCDQTDPFEAGIGFAVPADKADPYLGCDALARRRAKSAPSDSGARNRERRDDRPRRWSLPGPRQDGRGRQRDPITASWQDGRACACRRQLWRRGAGRDREVGRAAKRIPAELASFPAYDPQKTRVRV